LQPTLQTNQNITKLKITSSAYQKEDESIKVDAVPITELYINGVSFKSSNLYEYIADAPELNPDDASAYPWNREIYISASLPSIEEAELETIYKDIIYCFDITPYASDGQEEPNTKLNVQIVDSCLFTVPHWETKYTFYETPITITAIINGNVRTSSHSIIFGIGETKTT
jgi:hypothetical protein